MLILISALISNFFVFVKYKKKQVCYCEYYNIKTYRHNNNNFKRQLTVQQYIFKHCFRPYF